MKPIGNPEGPRTSSTHRCNKEEAAIEIRRYSLEFDVEGGPAWETH